MVVEIAKALPNTHIHGVNTHKSKPQHVQKKAQKNAFALVVNKNKQEISQP
jgi:hypothetical protein